VTENLFGDEKKKSARPRDYAYEALAEVTDAHPDANRGELNVALKLIREQTPQEDSYLLASEIHDRAKQYRAVMGEAMLTPTALAKHWVRVEATATRKPAGVNLSVSKECPTCDGDRFVVFATRKPTQSVWMRERGIEPDPETFLEEMAPCPDCGAELKGSPDPAKVRERLAR
jgi:hypothetical protein